MPLLETFANASRRGWFPGVVPAVDTGAFDLLATTILSTTTPSVTFDTSTYAALGYKHLQIRATIRGARNDYVDEVNLRLNADTGSNYNAHQLRGNYSSVSSTSSSGTSMSFGTIPGDTANSGNFAPVTIDFLDAFSNSKTKTIRSLNGYHNASSQALVALTSGLWRNTNAITSITISSGDFTRSMVSGCRFSIYGLKG